MLSIIRIVPLNNRKSCLTLATLDRPGTCHTAQSQESGEHRLPFLGTGKFCFLYSASDTPIFFSCTVFGCNMFIMKHWMEVNILLCHSKNVRECSEVFILY
jgi:hypothetical protein